MAGGGFRGAPGQIIDGRFELRDRLGHGGMGTVWRARDLALERDVALKEVRGEDETAGAGAETAAVRARVLAEARALARISHPHVVTVHHIVAAEPFPWIVMELLPGHTLETLLREGPVAPAEAARYAREILAALRAAHAAGICHRDVKPANVLLRADGSAVLTDFGIARAADAGTTQSGRIVGSPEYLAPERILGGRGDTAADLWSLGVLLHTLTEGRPPVHRSTVLATLAAVVEEPLPPPRRAGPLTPVIAGLLVKDPAERTDAARLDQQLAALAFADVPTASAPVALPAAVPSPYIPTADTPGTPGTPGTLPEPASRRLGPLVAAGAVLLAAALTAALVLLLPGNGDDGDDGDGGDLIGGGQDPGVPGATPDEERTEESPPPAETPDSPSAGGQQDPRESEPPTEDALSRIWIAQLYSEPVSSGTAVRDQRLAAVRAEVPDAEVLRSDDYPSLRPGYWVVYAPGPFADGRAAVRYCADHGRTTENQCVGRYLSDNTAHRELICFPADGGSGRCEE
jgi:serine/threonine protein kinase